MRLTRKDLAVLPALQVYNADAFKSIRLAGVSTDSRSVKEGELFIGIRGENFDGNTFTRDAARRGASCLIVEQHAEYRGLAIPIIVVEDGIAALGLLARQYRRTFSFPVLAVAGSNGKTTTKEMITAVLSTKFKVVSTQGNLNNHIGVPQTIFRFRPSHEVAVVEVGTNHFGELRYLCEVLEPTHGVITNIGREHLEFFGNLAGVARAEGELFEMLGATGLGIVNADDARIVRQAKALTKKVTYGFNGTGHDVQGTAGRMNEHGCMSFEVRAGGKKSFAVRLAVPGRHAMENALAAAAVGVTLRVPAAGIRRGLQGFSAVSKRMEVLRLGGVTILNDTYNANPDSVLSALRTMQEMECTGKRIAVLADMKELGAQSPDEHRRIGRAIKGMKCTDVLTVGELARCIYDEARIGHKEHFETKDMLAETLAARVSLGDIVLIKGSRSMKMEEVVAALMRRLGISGERYQRSRKLDVH